MALDDTGYDMTAQLLSKSRRRSAAFSSYWLYMDGKNLETAVVDRARRFRESQSADGLLRGCRLNTAYIFNEYGAALGLSVLRGDAWWRACAVDRAGRPTIGRQPQQLTVEQTGGVDGGMVAEAGAEPSWEIAPAHMRMW